MGLCSAGRSAALALLLALAAPAGVGAASGAWPPFLTPRERHRAEVVAAVEHVWRDPTLSRTVRGRSARVPLEAYIAFIDAPDVTTAAARDRGWARYEVRALDDDHYRADDRDGARGEYRVLVREATRRVMLSWGEHVGSILGPIHGRALTVLDLEAGADGVQQTVTAHVRIDNAVAAVVARILVRIFGRIADRRLAEGFAVSARVAEWAIERPAEFCHWLAEAPLPPQRRERVQHVLPACAPGRPGPPRELRR